MKSYILLCAFIVFAISACSNNQSLGKPIPADAPTATLAEVLAKPAAYNGSSVILKGTISAQCPSYCEFTFKDGNQSALIYPYEMKFPKLPVGKRVTLYGLITAGSGQTVISARGLRIGE